MTERANEQVPSGDRSRDEIEQEVLEIRDARGVRVAFAEVSLIHSPFPLCYVDRLRVEPEYRGRRYGSRMVEMVNDFLRRSNSVGILAKRVYGGTEAYDKKTRKRADLSSMYERHGWTYLDPEARQFMVFNAGTHTPEEIWDAHDKLGRLEM